MNLMMRQLDIPVSTFDAIRVYPYRRKLYNPSNHVFHLKNGGFATEC